MKMDELIERAQETLSARRVFGEAIHHGAMTVIPVADVAGGGGGGNDENHERTGGGFGLRARPAGIYVIEGDTIRWRPSVDINRLVATLAGVVVVFLFYRWRVAAIRSRN